MMAAVDTLPPGRAAALYKTGYSVCEIHDMYPRVTRRGIVARLRSQGVAGLSYCPVHRCFERVDLHPESGLDRHHET